MTFVTNKRTLAAILLLLSAIFVYLVYIDEHEQNNTANSVTAGPQDQAQEELLRQDEVNIKINGADSELEKKIKANDADFFVEYRLERDRNRSRQIELLQNIVNNPNSAPSERQEAQKKVIDITTMLEQELKLENLIKAKGYKEAILFIQPSSVIVIVQAQSIDANDATKIGDLIQRTTGHTMEQVTIIPKV